MNLAQAKAFAYGLAEADEGIILIKNFEIDGKKDVVGYLVVNRLTSSTPKKEGLWMVSINEGLQPKYSKKAFIKVTPKEYDAIVAGKRKLPEGVRLKDTLFSGVLVFTDIALMVESIRSWLYSVDNNDDPMMRMLGFKCKSGRSWTIKLTDLKKSINDKKNSKLLKLFSDRVSFLQYLNTKSACKK
jgi:hypothetical protein